MAAESVRSVLNANVMQVTRTRSSGIFKLFIWLCLPLYHVACPYKDCSCFPPSIVCEGLNAQVVPEIISSNMTGLTLLLLGYNNITNITKGSLIPNLETLNIEDNPVTNIDDEAFDGSNNTLTELSFSHVRFARIPDAFAHLNALVVLTISGANITDWNPNAWKNISQSLQSLQLYNVSMTTWPVWVQQFTVLEELSLNVGFISSIPDNAFDNMTNTLIYLFLDGNRLSSIPKALSKLNSLQMLYLENNLITDLEWFPQNSKLLSVTLDNNLISDAIQLSQVLRPYGNSMSHIELDSNNLTSIPDFSFLSQIDILDLTSNKISDTISGAVSTNVHSLRLQYNLLPLVPKLMSLAYSVTDVTISYNSITSLQEGDFHNQTTIIDLSYNMITQLTDSSFPEQFGVLYLNLNNNPLTYISPVALKRLTHITQLNIVHTKLTRLPLALGDLSTLVNINLSNSPDLVCTCAESSLRPWILKLGQFEVNGSCGNITVYEFFHILSPSCPT